MRVVIIKLPVDHTEGTAYDDDVRNARKASRECDYPACRLYPPRSLGACAAFRAQNSGSPVCSSRRFGVVLMKGKWHSTTRRTARTL